MLCDRDRILFLLFTVLITRSLLSAEPPFIISHVTVIDVTGRRPPLRDAEIVIQNGIIRSVSTTAGIPKKAHVLDGTGKYAIPGLWDMHVHLTDVSVSDLKNIILPLLLQNGITGVRDMGGNLSVIDEVRAEIKKGTLSGPVIFRPGPFVDGPKPGATDRLTVTNPLEARNAVHTLKLEKVDFIKVHNGISRDAFFALAEECKKEHIAFCVHLPTSISVREAVDAGAKSVEHTETLLESGMRETKGVGVEGAMHVLDLYTGSDGVSLWRDFVKHRTWFTPTLIEYKRFSDEGEESVDKDPRMKLIPQSLKDFWEKNFPVPKEVPAEKRAARQKAFQKFVAVVQSMHQSGVALLAGTDLGARGVYPGSSLHEELKLLVEAGLTPLEALQTATIEPARFFSLSDREGSIQRGKVADILLLEKDPLSDIVNTQTISAVILHGKLLKK